MEKKYEEKLSGKRGRGRPQLTFETSISKILEESHVDDPPEGMYEEVDDNGRGERCMQGP